MKRLSQMVPLILIVGGLVIGCSVNTSLCDNQHHIVKIRQSTGFGEIAHANTAVATERAATAYLDLSTSTPTTGLQDSGLSISMAQFPGIAFADSAIIYTITVTNNGPGAARSVLLSDQLPSQVWLFQCSSTSAGTCSSTDNLVTVSFDSLAQGQGAVVSIEVVVDCAETTGAVISNTATVSCASCAGSQQNASDSITVFHQPPFVVCPADISVNAAPGQTTAQVNYAAPLVRDKCQIASSDCVPASGSPFPIGVTQVNCTATDISGTSALCSFNVVVGPPGPFISGVTITGKKLVVSGSAFDAGAMVLMNGKAQKTSVIQTGGESVLSSKKAARQIAPGQTVMIQVKNSDDELSNQITYTRPD